MAEEMNRQMIQYHFFATKEQAEQIEKRMRKIGVRNKCAAINARTSGKWQSTDITSAWILPM